MDPNGALDTTSPSSVAVTATAVGAEVGPGAGGTMRVAVTAGGPDGGSEGTLVPGPVPGSPGAESWWCWATPARPSP